MKTRIQFLPIARLPLLQSPLSPLMPQRPYRAGPPPLIVLFPLTTDLTSRQRRTSHSTAGNWTSTQSGLPWRCLPDRKFVHCLPIKIVLPDPVAVNLVSPILMNGLRWDMTLMDYLRRQKRHPGLRRLGQF